MLTLHQAAYVFESRLSGLAETSPVRDDAELRQTVLDALAKARSLSRVEAQPPAAEPQRLLRTVDSLYRNPQRLKTEEGRRAMAAVCPSTWRARQRARSVQGERADGQGQALPSEARQS